MDCYKTEQEVFWAGKFGDDYIERNKDKQLHQSNLRFFSNILQKMDKINSVIEFGANIGMNLKAISDLVGPLSMSGVEINRKAAKELEKIANVQVHNCSILDFVPPKKHHDLSLAKTVLIHIPPEELGKVYQLLYESSCRYVCIAEYYSPNPVEVTYRGHSERLFKRDFAGEMMASYPDMKLIDYGFSYKRDPVFPQDDITWFLMEKKG